MVRPFSISAIQATTTIAKDFPDLDISSEMDAISGLLYVPLSPKGQDFMLFLRKGQKK